MALAEYTHHASRGQTRARAREGVENEKYVSLHRSLHFRGSGRGLPPEPEPQGGAVTDGYVAAPAPPLAVPLLASGRRSRRPLHLPVPPHARHRDEEGLGGGGEEEEGAGVGRTAPRQGPCWRASLCRRAWGLVRDLLSLHREEEEEEKEKEEKVP